MVEGTGWRHAVRSGVRTRSRAVPATTRNVRVGSAGVQRCGWRRTSPARGSCASGSRVDTPPDPGSRPMRRRCADGDGGAWRLERYSIGLVRDGLDDRRGLLEYHESGPPGPSSDLRLRQAPWSHRSPGHRHISEARYTLALGRLLRRREVIQPLTKAPNAEKVGTG